MTDATRTQRLGAYAVVIVDQRILLTRISPVGYPAGSWTLPGGGVDHGESPHDAVVRELHEETGLQALTSRLVDVHDVHVVAEGRDDRWEDYHGVHLLYAVEVDPTVEPHVVDVGGTTDVARWVAVADVGAAVSPVLPMVEHALAHADQFVAGV
ncbi:NUDIX domain-containing protein [Aeromicrobium sp. CFBP 8757]|uniref:NUDIX hydrolase n=1 Tax=Aeromicrobium sp. CFBP 8757 TaxID=2775288 RepID=UPI00177BAC8C|nr:NUDIX domain-containing protein [Aeromicrobium sp. CFBP 8757]